VAKYRLDTASSDTGFDVAGAVLGGQFVVAISFALDTVFKVVFIHPIVGFSGRISAVCKQHILALVQQTR
jgi:hypothetical protein